MEWTLLRICILVALSLSLLPARAVERCYSVAAPGAPSENLPQRLPELLILKDSPWRDLFAQPGDYQVDWIGTLAKKRYGAGSYWRQSPGQLTLVLGDGFTGIRLSLTSQEEGFTGTASHYADVPVPLPSYGVRLDPVACPGQRSNNSFKPTPLRGSA